jgi:hypothetical protein
LSKVSNYISQGGYSLSPNKLTLPEFASITTLNESFIFNLYLSGNLGSMDSLGRPSFTQSDIDKVCKMYGDVLPYRLVLTPENPLAVITHTGEDDKFYKYNRLRCLISSLGPGFSDLKISQFNTWNTSSEQTLFNKIKHGVNNS